MNRHEENTSPSWTGSNDTKKRGTVVFDVSGWTFKVLRQTIESRPNTLLASLLGSVGANSDCDDPIFVDANPERFVHILDWYRYNEMYVQEFAVGGVLRDAKFFSLPDTVQINGISHAIKSSRAKGTHDEAFVVSIPEHPSVKGAATEESPMHTGGSITPTSVESPNKEKQTEGDSEGPARLEAGKERFQQQGQRDKTHRQRLTVGPDAEKTAPTNRKGERKHSCPARSPPKTDIGRKMLKEKERKIDQESNISSPRLPHNRESQHTPRIDRHRLTEPEKSRPTV